MRLLGKCQQEFRDLRRVSCTAGAQRGMTKLNAEREVRKLNVFRCEIFFIKKDRYLKIPQLSLVSDF